MECHPLNRTISQSLTTVFASGHSYRRTFPMPRMHLEHTEPYICMYHPKNRYLLRWTLTEQDGYTQYGNTRSDSPITPCLLWDCCCCCWMRTAVTIFTLDMLQTCLMDPSVTKIVNVQVKTYKLSKLQLEVFFVCVSCISSSLLQWIE